MTDMIILRERVITIKAGDTFDQSLQGNVLRVTAGQVALRVQDREGQMDFTLLAGERAEFPGEFPGLILSHTSGVDQTFTIQVGKGVNVASALVSGTVVITGTPTFISGGGTLTSITNAVKTVSDGQTYGASFKNNTLLAASAVETIFAPGANVNGAIIHAAGFLVANNVAGYQAEGAFLAKASAPANVNDGDSILAADALSLGGTFFAAAGSLKNPLRIPAGKGLYFYNPVAMTFQSHRSVLYTLL